MCHGWLVQPCVFARHEGTAGRASRGTSEPSPCVERITAVMERGYTFPKSLHLRKPAEFAAVYDAKVRESRGPLLIYSMPNTLGHPRIGLSTSRKVGTAPRRNRIRRMLREAFRLMQHDLPTGYD